MNTGTADRSGTCTGAVSSREPVNRRGDRRGTGGGHGSGRTFAWDFHGHAQQVQLLPVDVLRVILKAATGRLSDDTPPPPTHTRRAVLTLALEWYDRVPLLDSVTNFFFHSLFRELPLRFHRMLCPRSKTQRRSHPSPPLKKTNTVL